MKTRRLTKKYKNKRNRKSRKSGKSRKIKNKSRKRILKGGVRPSSRSSRSSRASVAPIPSSRGTSRDTSIGISKPIILSKTEILSKCCQPKVISEGERIIKSITNFPHSFHEFYDSLLKHSEDELKEKIPEIKQKYLDKITIDSEGKYPNITGLQLISYLIFKRIKSGEVDRDKMTDFISLLDQCAAAPGVRNCDLGVIKKLVGSDYFECYKKLYEDISAKLFRCGNGYCYPVSTSAISLYCKPRFKPTLQTTHENDE
jgi:ribosome assembly protein YihI (activator of Der GTPase)